MEFTENDTRMIIDIIHAPKTAIVCRTQDEANSLLSMLNSQGIRWASGDSCLDHTNWETYGRETEYNLADGYLKFGTIHWALEHGYTIIYFEDIFATRVSLLDILLT